MKYALVLLLGAAAWGQTGTVPACPEGKTPHDVRMHEGGEPGTYEWTCVPPIQDDSCVISAPVQIVVGKGKSLTLQISCMNKAHIEEIVAIFIAQGNETLKAKVRSVIAESGSLTLTVTSGKPLPELSAKKKASALPKKP